jgi:hypothetical protein
MNNIMLSLFPFLRSEIITSSNLRACLVGDEMSLHFQATVFRGAVIILTTEYPI